MSAFNTVDVIRLEPCPRCGDTGAIAVQFAYGDTQQHSYSIGDTLSWGGNDIGERGRSEVSVLGTPEYCRVCGLAVEGEYVLIISNDRIVGYRKASLEDIAELE